MGNTSSQLPTHNVFNKELSMLNAIVNDIISDKDIFKNKSYNFLSENVCTNYQVILEDELSKHLKLDINALGTSLYILPKDENSNTKLTKYNLSKAQVC